MVRQQCIRLIATATLLLAGVGQVLAQDDSPLWSYLSAQTQAEGRFEQSLYAETGELLEESRGQYRLLRPGYFRWDIEEPDSQLIVVADDELWHYDRDLASATRRNAAEQGSFSALELLAGDGEDLRRRFSVTDLGNRLGMDRYRLVPVYAGAGFSAIELQWKEGVVVGMSIRDRSGQEIRLALMPEDSGEALSPSDFEFTVPDGVEVFDAFEP